MTPFEFTRPADIGAALQALATPGSLPISGGTNLIDLMKEGVMAPATLVDINRLGLDSIEDDGAGGLRLGAMARNAATAYHPLVAERYPLLAQAVLAGASPSCAIWPAMAAT